AGNGGVTVLLNTFPKPPRPPASPPQIVAEAFRRQGVSRGRVRDAATGAVRGVLTPFRRLARRPPLPLRDVHRGRPLPLAGRRPPRPGRARPRPRQAQEEGVRRRPPRPAVSRPRHSARPSRSRPSTPSRSPPSTATAWPTASGLPPAGAGKP